MAETTDPQAAPTPDNTHWGVAYLREDLQDLRLQLREDVKDLRQLNAETNKRIDETNRRIDRTNELIGSRFAWLITTMVALAGILAALIKL
ncbi:MAG: hypothetical protein OYM47_09255 [Gemmatimonadota bacterium]|nr:hypothetical protein [Gemmatimonadota bacterium]